MSYILITSNNVFAVWEDPGLLGWISWKDSVEKVQKLRNGNVWFWDIPGIIIYVLEYILWISATLFMLMMIVWAFKLMMWSISAEKNKWKDAIKWGIIWFIITASSWWLMRLIIANLIK